MFVEHGTPPSITNNRKVTPLHMACRFDLPRVAERLVALGAAVDAYDASRETPLYRAVNLGYADCVRVLIAAQADVDFQNRRGETPLLRAARRGKKLIVPLLLAAGADPRIPDRVRQGAIGLRAQPGDPTGLGRVPSMTALVTDPACLEHEMGPRHPERPARLEAVLERLDETGLLADLETVTAPEATRQQIIGVHEPDYVDAIERLAPSEGLVRLDPDTFMGPRLPAGGARRSRRSRRRGRPGLRQRRGNR